MSLLPCPFCGSDEHLSVSSVGSLTHDMPSRPYRVRCNHIDHDSVEGPVSYGKAEAMAAWNTRAPAATASPESRGDGVQEAIETGPSVEEVRDHQKLIEELEALAANCFHPHYIAAYTRAAQAIRSLEGEVFRLSQRRGVSTSIGA